MQYVGAGVEERDRFNDRLLLEAVMDKLAFLRLAGPK